VNTINRNRRNDSPARWCKAAERAAAEGIEVRQCAGSGLWIATSGTDAGTAYELDVYGAVAAGCSCLAGLNDDPVCKHRAAFYLMLGALDFDPEPPTPAAPVESELCRNCKGAGVVFPGYWARGEWHGWTEGCTECGGSGKTAPRRTAA
jgi:hypothetical protein